MNNINLLIDESEKESIVKQRKKIASEGLSVESDFEDKLSVLAKELLLNVKHQHFFVSSIRKIFKQIYECLATNGIFRP